MKAEKHKPIPILAYHSIGRSAGHKFLPFIVRPDDFEAQMALLNEFGCTPMTVGELAASMQNPSKALPEHPIAITFDDGFADFYDEALPILQRYGFPATVYPATAYVGSRSKWLFSVGEDDRPMMTWAMLREANKAGIEIGAHSHSHPELDLLTGQQAFEEIQKPKTLLEARVGTAVNSFAYPYGYHTAQTIQIVREVGYTSACAVKQALSFKGDNLFALSRVSVFVDTHLADLRRWLRGEGLPIAPQNEPVRSKMWRLYRQWRSYAS